ncbi:hypothetical protein RE432_14865 [Pusillimonas sp. SM2304]|uniref:hypothetical protein n=1 Tax=Pusillimonas sp. SM2304 TaxID=3073241 RepID=UPI0028763641|nr:hypothetical protein [Pusillimonas sp. SM2304]MDS1141721.1 hypothetical protein [Pusillimonas sp. SM2304]
MSTVDEAQIEQYLKDPMSMPEGEELTALLAGDEATDGKPNAQPSNEQPELDKGETAAGAAPGATDTPTDEPKQPDPASTATPAQPEDPNTAVVKSKDGKHEIPYTVLQSERERAIRAERAAQELTEKLTLLQQAAESGASVKTSSLDDIVDPELLSTLREESPGVADVLDKLIGKINTLEDSQAKAATFVEQGTREAAIQSQMTVEEAIAALPKLSHIRTADPAAYNEIAEFDSALRAQSKWQGKPMQERFEAAVRMYEAANGQIELPGAKTPPAAKPDEKDTEAKVAAAVAKAQGEDKGPNTLSDIPGGAVAASNDQDALGELSSVALTERFLNMDPEQIQAELARLS